MEADEIGPAYTEKQPLGLGTIVLRSVIGLNFLRFLLAFVPGFEEGKAGGPGLADRIFNPRHSDGFRSDAIWLFFSTVAIFLAIFAYFPSFKHDKAARLNVFLCAAWIAAFLLLVAHVLSIGVLDFG